jgi:hypothetical protein
MNEDNEDQTGWYMLKGSVNHKTLHTLFLTQPWGEESEKDKWRL